nr:RagB/SusD family nutrient uptake outer membrane protein [Cytophagales bacterium]
MKKNAILIAMILLVSGLFIKCSDDFLNVSNPNEIDAASFFNSIDDFELSLTSVYAASKSFDLYGGNLYPQLLFTLPKTVDQDWLGTDGWNQNLRNAITPDNGLLNQFWRGFYRGVARSNDFIFQAERYLEEGNPTQAETTRLNQMIGEAMFFRAFFYYHLVRLWGEDIPARNSGARGVPLILEVANSRDAMFVSRSTVGEVFEQIIRDLEQAESRLPESWPTQSIARVTSYASKSLLGRVHMCMGNMSTAGNYFEQIINSGRFSLVPFEDYMGLFNGENEFSEESLFEINLSTDLQENAWQGGLGSNMALLLAPKGTGWSNVYPHDVNIRRFGNDPRLRINALEPGVDSVTFGDGRRRPLQRMVDDEGALGWSFRKWVPTDFSVFSTNRNFGANIIVDRLADVYLLYAETLLGTNDAMALEYVNKVIRRAHNQDPNSPSQHDLSGVSGNTLLAAIQEERFKELFAEGHRWYDIVRWGIFREELAKYPSVRSGPVLASTALPYLPIPQAEMDVNINIEQSDGY